MSLIEDAPHTRPRFHKVAIADVRRETDDAVSIAFDIPDDLADDFRYVPGQYLTLRTEIDGRDVRRSYSIASGLGDGEWRVAIKRVEGGLFSAFATERLAAGDVMELMPPAGRFILPNAEGPRTIVAFAAGSGITPIASQIRTVLLNEPQTRVFLFYGNQTSRSILFREAIEDLKDRYMARLSVHNVLSREAQDIDTLHGRIDAQKVAAFMRHVVPLASVDHFVLCGPSEFLDEIVDALADLGVPDERILMERFTPSTRTAPKAAPQPGEPETSSESVAVTLDGVTTAVTLEPGEHLLDAALRAGLDAPFSCRAGMCCTCRAKVTAGEAVMDVNFALREDEVAEGFVLTCQTRPVGKGVAVDYDVA